MSAKLVVWVVPRHNSPNIFLFIEGSVIVETPSIGLFCTVTQDKSEILWLYESETLTYVNPKSVVPQKNTKPSIKRNLSNT